MGLTLLRFLLAASLVYGSSSFELLDKRSLIAKKPESGIEIMSDNISGMDQNKMESKRFEPFSNGNRSNKRFDTGFMRNYWIQLDQNKRNTIDPQAFQIGFGKR
ncbi:unnamed protein product [Caenorhabditis bovis]|uniref:EF-hand domain-containing protein n=1 Tax=Caenorhabditis bovis TaxID=2654633 RepID=A0A8S1ESQ4_9PELO|nr:unnamed protein product [Caenorhabditis bovis]